MGRDFLGFWDREGIKIFLWAQPTEYRHLVTLVLVPQWHQGYAMLMHPHLKAVYQGLQGGGPHRDLVLVASRETKSYSWK